MPRWWIAAQCPLGPVERKGTQKGIQEAAYQPPPAIGATGPLAFRDEHLDPAIFRAPPTGTMVLGLLPVEHSPAAG